MFRHTYQATVLSVVRQGFLSGLAVVLVFCSLGTKQATAQQGPERDAQALSFIASSLQVLTGSVSVSDLTLQSTTAYVAGSDQETGTATLIARGNQQSLVLLNLDAGQREQVRNGAAGYWSGPDGVAHPTALHNCWVDAPWFYPALILQALAADSTLGVVYLGPAQWNGLAVIHLQFSHLVPGQMAGITIQIQSLSTSDLYFDPKFLWPLAMDFNTHPDNDLNQNIPIEIQFGGYSAASGILVPFQIQKFLQGTLTLNFTVTRVAVNSGVPASVFTIPQFPTGGAQ